MEISYSIPHYDNSPQNYYWFSSAFNTEELEQIQSIVERIDYKEAGTFESEGFSEVRRSKIKWLHKNSETEWIYDRLLSLVKEANDSLWHFDITSMNEDIQYTEYHAEDEGHYTWHQDIGPGIAAQRKISITIQLSDSDAYEGGDLQIWQGGTSVQDTRRGAGVAVLFPSYMMHRVTKTTKGVRKSLVLWVGGNHYR